MTSKKVWKKPCSGIRKMDGYDLSGLAITIFTSQYFVNKQTKGFIFNRLGFFRLSIFTNPTLLDKQLWQINLRLHNRHL